MKNHVRGTIVQSMINNFIFKKNFYVFFLISFIFILDRISKFLIIKKTEEINQAQVYSSDFINLELVWNNGIAFGLLSFDNNTFYNLITFTILLILIILIYFIYNTKNFEKLGFIFITGGALGNLYDRLIFRAVPDFIDFHIDNLHWFIFNIADIFITFGIICLILVEIFFKKKI